MLTDIGKELRKLRIETDERLMDMAKRLDKSASFISAVEVGKKSPPSDFEEAVIKIYQLAGDAAEALRRAADRSRKAFTIEPSSALGRDTAALLARRINNLSDSQLKEIREILFKGSKPA
ncbi:XRE family transcriptional regulator [Bradyrhizobium sp. CCBAU 53351]|uniref:helix-turn-helix domain-containing protein n=1 Tax=Bradyrhizobium sp. CCBAU 53351 TaxID=1325114 RepID=UPI001886FDBD|nr:helix-turn-helix domain-containing protein [Bradyrhizobium sp. CCBAU 53351]QOZ74091.1 XRE family transcriptional regulator [Bradyrhizobium sp. CCBAU 53351]